MKNLKFYNGFCLNGIKYAEYVSDRSFFLKNGEAISFREYTDAYIIYLNKIERN